MSSTIELRELRNAFDRFSVWILVRYVTNTNASVNVVHGKNIQHNLGNYMLALISDRKDGLLELVLLEFHLTKAQFESVPKNAREQKIAQVIRYWNLSSECSIKHYLYIANKWPALEAEAVEGLSLLTNNDLHLFDLSLMSTNALCLISATREQRDARNRNVYEIRMDNGQTIREMIHLLPKSIMRKPSVGSCPAKAQYLVNARPVNGIKLEDLSVLLKSGVSRAPLGLFLVRQAKLKNILLYVKKCCVDRLENVTQDTWFLVSEVIPFETTFPDHTSVHEVAYVKDYGMVFWLRSRGPQTSIGKHFTISCRNEYDSVPPAPCWLNVLVSNVSDGSTTYLQRVAATAKQADPFQLIAQVQAIDAVNVLQQPVTTAHDKLCSLFGVRSDAERDMVASVQLVLLIDHAIADNGSDFMAHTLVQFLNATDDTIRRRMTVWIVGDDLLWAQVATNCKHAMVMKHSMPKLEEEQWKECLSRMVKQDKDDVGSLAEAIIASNSRSIGHELFGNLFILNVLAEAVNDYVDSEQHCKPSYWWIDAMEQYIRKRIAPPESKELEKLQKYCYERVCVDSTDHTEHFSTRSPIEHRTLQMLLAAKHLAKHPHLIDIAIYHRVGYDLIDLLLFRDSAVGIAVLHHDVETVRQSTLEELQASDCLQRNLLHVVRNSKEIADILLSAGIPLDQHCAAQLNNWTPLQATMDRNDWSLVDRLLAKGAELSSNETKLHCMSISELAEVFCDCISDNCTTLIEWILRNRSDYQITQQNIYSLSVYEEFDTDLLFRLLTVAEEQGLPAREPPYRYIFDNSALDNAVEDDRIELAIFLVERLHFEPTDEFLELRSRYQQNVQLKEYKKLFELCKAGELAKVRKMIEDEELDPRYEYDGSNLFIQAASSGNLELVRYLFETHGFNERLDDCDEHGCSAISQALVEGHQPIVQFLLHHNASVKPSWIKNCPNQLPDDVVEVDTEDFLSLIECRREKLERLTIDYGRYESGELLLHCYIRYVDEPDEDTFRFLLSQYDNVDVRTDATSELRLGETPLHIAFQNGNKRCREILIKAGADVHAKSSQHELTSLHYAIMGGADKSLIKRLIEVYGFDVNARDKRGRTISFYMPLNDELYHWLIDEFEFNPCAPDNNGQTVLHHRLIRNSFFARAEIEYLLRMPQFFQSSTDKRGRLPLHYAVEANNLAIVQLLVKYRSDLHNVPDCDGITALQLAHNLNHSTICDFFSKLEE